MASPVSVDTFDEIKRVRSDNSDKLEELRDSQDAMPTLDSMLKSRGICPGEAPACYLKLFMEDLANGQEESTGESG